MKRNQQRLTASGHPFTVSLSVSASQTSDYKLERIPAPFVCTVDIQYNGTRFACPPNRLLFNVLLTVLLRAGFRAHRVLRAPGRNGRIGNFGPIYL